jgi:[ribosomal protein S5]-alanine N-acetyltransferase
MLKTTNLQLLTIERIHIEAFLRSKSELAETLHVAIPNSWPTFPEAFSIPAEGSHESNPPTNDWNGFFFIDQKNIALVGNGGFYGPPDDLGAVEIGYEIASEYWNRGFATEAVQAMINFAFAHEEVRIVRAHTLAEQNASNRVLQKVGMKFVAEIDGFEQGKTWRWQISRDE